MDSRMVWIGAGLLGGMLVLSSAGCTANARSARKAHGNKIAINDVPQPVVDSMNARFPGAEFTSIEKETENGNVVYDFELNQQGHKFEADVKEDGTIIEIEREVRSRDVLPALKQTIESKFPGASITQVMEVDKLRGQQELPDHYEVLLSQGGGKNKEVNVSLDGRTISEEAPDAGGE